MTHNLSDKEYALVMIGYLLIVFLIIYSLINNVNAYTISKTRNITIFNSAKAVNFNKPNSLILNKTQIDYLNNYKAEGGLSWAYQSGFDDAVNNINVYLGIREKNKFRISPKLNNQGLVNQICFPTIGNYFNLNLSAYNISSDFSFNVTKNLSAYRYSNMLQIHIEDIKLNNMVIRVYAK